MTKETNITDREMDFDRDNATSIIKNEVKRLRDIDKKNKAKDIYYGVISILIFLLIWQLACVFGLVNKKMLASPIEVITTTIRKLYDPRPEGNTLFVNIFASFQLTVFSYIFSIFVGLPLGLLMGWYKPIDKLVRPIFELMRPLPPIAWIPIVIILLGIGAVAKSFIIFFTTFVPILINSYTGIKETNQTLINFSKTCGYSNWSTFLSVGVPSAMPLAFAGMRIALGNGWATLIAAEMLAANKGLGYMISMGRTYGRIDIILCGMLVIGLIGLLLTSAIGKLEKRVIKWSGNRQ